MGKIQVDNESAPRHGRSPIESSIRLDALGSVPDIQGATRGKKVWTMEKESTHESARTLRLKVMAALYGPLFAFLVLSEYLNAVFSRKFDLMGLSAIQRVPFAFKPTAMVLFLVFTTILFLIVLRFLKPLFDFIEGRADAEKARGAAIRMPWVIILFQVVAWSLGTLFYYATHGWVTEVGMPLAFGIMSKIVTGFISSMYVAFCINLILQDARRSLGIKVIRPGERDIFSRIKDYLATIAGTGYIVGYSLFIAQYYSSLGTAFDLLPFLQKALPAFLALGLVGIVPIFLSKREFRLQVKGILKEMRELTQGTQDGSRLIDIVTFDELGELSMHVNRNILQFREFSDSIRSLAEHLTEASLSLAATAQQSSSVSNQQAAAVAEVVSTMEDSDRLGKSAAERAAEVDSKSVRTLETATDGVGRIGNYLESMDSIRKANDGTMEFIKSLNEDIKTIWDVVRMINSLANQVKIIAFNAELEASSAGAAGKNFEIVATEIRRLADNTVASTAEIRDKTKLIERAALNLIESSESTTKAIESGCENSRRIQEAFNLVKTSSEDASASARAINDGIRMQTAGSEQILLTMKQIAHSASDFAQSTKMLSDTSRSLNDMVVGMSALANARSKE